MGELLFDRWLELDRILVQLWESCSVRPRVAYLALNEGRGEMRVLTGCMLPEIAGRGIIDLGLG